MSVKGVWVWMVCECGGCVGVELESLGILEHDDVVK